MAPAAPTGPLPAPCGGARGDPKAPALEPPCESTSFHLPHLDPSLRWRAAATLSGIRRSCPSPRVAGRLSGEGLMACVWQ